MTVAEYIIQYLESIGVKHIFIVVGGGSIYLDDALANSQIKPVFCLHEQAAAMAAETYGQCNGLGVLLVTTGPGVTNTLTGVAGAYLESTPLLVISGQVNTFHSRDTYNVRQFGFQEVDTENLVKPIVKQYIKIKKSDTEKLPDILGDLLYTVFDGRSGPAWLDVPQDVQNTTINNITLKHKVGLEELLLPQEHITLIDNLLNTAKKPLILLGNGIRPKEQSYKDLVRQWNIPTLCTWKTFDLFHQDDPLYMGRPGIISSRYANKLQQECDLLICFGARLDLGQVAFQYKNFAPYAKKIIFDIDINEITKNRLSIPNSYELCYNLRVIIGQLLQINKTTDTSEWNKYCIKTKKDNDLRQEHLKDPLFTYYKVLPFIEEGLQEHVIVHGSSGSVSEMTCQALQLKQPTRVIGTHGLGSMGYGLPASIGAYFAIQKRVVCIEGDGSLAMNMQELELLKRANLPICLIIVNNNGYVSIRNTQKKLKQKEFGSGPCSGLTLPDYKEIARAFSIPYFKITRYDIEELPRLIKSYSRPIIVEVFIDEHTAYPRTQTKIVDGHLTTLPMENLS